MDLTTLAYLVVLGLALLGTDAVLHHNSVLVEVSSSPKTDKITVDEKTLTTDFKDDIDAITKTVSLQSMARPEIQSTGAEGVGMALATAFHLQSVAYALQSQFDVRPDRIRFALLIENGELRGFVGGQSARLGEFHRIMAPKSGEKTMQFVHRCALWAAGQLAPYSTALFLLKRHAADGNFDQVVAIAKAAEAMLPPTPRSYDRAFFDNLLGLVALFKNDPKSARHEFHRAMLDDPTDPVPFLNAALTDLQLDDNRKAADRMEKLLRVAPPENKALLMTAYMTWGAALMGLNDLPRADRMLEEATKIDPHGAAALSLRAEEKRLAGDPAAAAGLDRKAAAQTANFQNYIEVAALWFHLSWRGDEPVIRSKFVNPGFVTFH